MGHQNAKKTYIFETLYKTESPKKKIQQHNTLGENLRGWGGGLNITSSIPVISKSTEMSCKHNSM